MPFVNKLNSAGYPRYGTVMNIIMAPINLLKTFSLQGPAGQSTSDGYPNGTLSSTVISQGTAPDGYYDKFVMRWDGQARWDSAGTSAIVYSNTGVTVPGISNSCVSANLALTSSNVTGNRIVFKHGSLITAVSGGGGSAVVLTLINTPSDMSVGQKVKISVGVSANLANGPNSDGSWTLSAVGTTSATLASSSGVTSPTITGAGGPDVQSEMVFSKPGIAWNFGSGNTYTSFANAIFCKIANEAACVAGKHVDPDYIAQLKALGVRWLRTMDITGVQGNWEADWAARRPTSFITWAASTRNPNYYVGTITNTADAYTCSAPTITSTGAYKAGEIVQGVCSATNSGGTPTLNVNGRGAKRIIQTGNWYRLLFGGAAASAGQSLQYTFSASWFNGGTPYVFTYTTTTTGHWGDDTASISILQANVAFALAADVTLNGSIASTDSGSVAITVLTPQKGLMTLSYSGPVSCTVYSIAPSTFSSSGTSTFIFSYIHDAWLYRSGGLVQSAPHEYFVELANALSANVWHNWNLVCSGSFATSLVSFYRDNLSTGLKFGGEVGNELWNFGQEPWAYAVAFGWALGMGTAQNFQNPAAYSYSAARARQLNALGITAWTTTRPTSDYYTLVMSATFDLANTDQYFLGCQFLGNATFTTYGGLDGASGSTNAATDYSQVGQRVGDNFDGMGQAPYWGSDFLSGDTGGSGFNTNTLTGTVAQNAPLFAAALKYQQANTSGAYDDLFNQFYANVSLGGPASGLNLLRHYKNGNDVQLEAILRKWDSARIAAKSKPIAVLHYEAGPQFGLGNINNGTNSPTTDIAAVTTHIQNNITNNSWDISPYVISGTNTASELATSLCGMVYNFKFSTQFYQLYYNYMRDVTVVHSGREACASQYGYFQTQWGLFPGSWTVGASTAYSSYQAIADFNAGL